MELRHEESLMEQEEETAAARARGDSQPVPASEADAKALADAAVRYLVPALSHVEPRSVGVFTHADSNQPTLNMVGRAGRDQDRVRSRDPARHRGEGGPPRRIQQGKGALPREVSRWDCVRLVNFSRRAHRVPVGRCVAIQHIN